MNYTEERQLNDDYNNDANDDDGGDNYTENMI